VLCCSLPCQLAGTTTPLKHLMCMFDFIRKAIKAGYVLNDAAAVEWAVWFHDVIYDATSTTNEADSAALAAELLEAAGLPPATISKVGTPAQGRQHGQRHRQQQPCCQRLSTGVGSVCLDKSLVLDAPPAGQPGCSKPGLAASCRLSRGSPGQPQPTSSRSRCCQGGLSSRSAPHGQHPSCHRSWSAATCSRSHQHVGTCCLG